VGAISHLDFHQQNEFYFQLELNNNKGIHHNLHYDVVLFYVDKSHPSFVHYRLPYAAIANPTDDQVQSPAVQLLRLLMMVSTLLHPHAATIADKIDNQQ
jgi:hypothetical protein